MSEGSCVVLVTYILDVEIPGGHRRVYSDGQPGVGWLGTLPFARFGPFTDRTLAEQAAVKLCARPDVASISIEEA